MSSKDLQAVVKTQKAFIRELLDRLERKLIYNDENDELYFKVQDDEYSFCEILAFLNDDYFKGLSLPQILELAKKSIRLTDENCEMRHKLEDIEEILEQKDLCSECKDTCCTKFSEKIKNILDK